MTQLQPKLATPAATALLIAAVPPTLASFLVSDNELLPSALLTSAAVLAVLASLTILLSGRGIGVLGLLGAGAMHVSAGFIVAAVQAQADPTGDDQWQSLSDVFGAMIFGVAGCILAVVTALVVFWRTQNSTVRSVAT